MDIVDVIFIILSAFVVIATTLKIGYNVGRGRREYFLRENEFLREVNSKLRKENSSMIELMRPFKTARK